MKNEGRTVTAVVLFFAAVLAAGPLSDWSGYFATKVYHFSDEGIVVHAAERASHGDPPHLAFQYYYSGGLEIFLGLLFNLVGSSFVTARWLLAFSMSLTVLFSFFLHTKAGISTPTSAASSFAITLFAHLVNYHINPAWVAMPPVILGMLLLLSGVEHNRASYILLAGVCLGVATSLKQNTGIYAFGGFLVFTTWSASVQTGTPPPTSAKIPHRHALPNGRLVLALLTPVGVLIFFLLVIRDALTPLNFLMFGLPQSLMAGFASYSLWKSTRISADVRDTLVQHHERNITLLTSGFVLGFLPIVAYYAIAGGLYEFFDEAFFRVHGVFTKRLFDWEFTAELAPLTSLRRLSLHLLPQLAIVVAFVIVLLGSKRRLVDTRVLTMFLLAAVLTALHFTLFPLLGAIYLLYLLILISLPFVLLFDEHLKRLIVKPLHRAMALLFLFVILITGYLVSRLAAGDWAHQDIVAKRVARLEGERGGIYLPFEDVEYVTPILEYLKGRSQKESFLAFDRICEAVAFLTGRTSHVDYGLKYYESLELGEEDFSAIERFAEDYKIDTIILGKRYLSHWQAGLPVLDFLKKNYTLALDNPSHLIYQRIPN